MEEPVAPVEPVKPNACCVDCPREKATTTHPYVHVPTTILPHSALIIITEAPICNRYGVTSSQYDDDCGKIIKRAVADLRRLEKYRDLAISYTYAVSCTSNQTDTSPPKAVLQHCKTVLLEALSGVITQPVFLTLGMAVLRELGIKVSNLKEMQGRLLPAQTVGNLVADVVVTVSTKQLITIPGLYNTFLADLQRAADAACQGGASIVPTLEALTTEYWLPKTVEEVAWVCRGILAYQEGDKSAEDWPISVDTETNTKFPHRDKLEVLAVSFAWATGRATAIPLWHPLRTYDPDDVLPYVLELLASNKPKLFHNAKFDLKVFMKKGWELRRFAWDSMLGEHVLEEDKRGLYGLKPLTRTYFPDFATYADDLHEKLEAAEGASQLENLRKDVNDNSGEDDGGFEKIPLPELLLYAAVDADMTRRLTMLQGERIIAEQKQVPLCKTKFIRDQAKEHPLLRSAYKIPTYNTHPQPVRQLALRTVFPVTPVLARMEFEGITIDRPYLEQVQEGLEKVIQETTRTLYDMAGGEMKLNSAAEIATILFEKGYTHPVTHEHVVHPLTEDIPRTKTGKIQTTAKVMQWLVAKHECTFAAKKLIYAKAYKAKNTFGANILELSSLDGRLHTSYHQHGTRTGRTSSSDENMQNIPSKLGGVNIKKVFIPDDDSYLIVNADAKGAEVRILTAYCKDKALIESLNVGQDTHCFIASQIIALVRQSPGAAEELASMGLDDTYPLMYLDFANREAIKAHDAAYGGMLDKFRTAVKRVVFGILYGAGPTKIAETIGISLQQAQQLIAMLFAMFPSIQKYIEQTHVELQRLNFVETFFGRRRRFYLPGAPPYLRGRAERQTVNFKIQSTSSDIVLGRLVALEKPLRDLGGRLLLTVHDSIGFQIPKKYATQIPDLIKTVLEDGVKTQHPWLPVAFKWDYEVGPSYGELKPLEAYLASLPSPVPEPSELQQAYNDEDAEVILAEEEEDNSSTKKTTNKKKQPTEEPTAEAFSDTDT